MNSLAGIDMGRILLDLSNEVIKQLDDLEVQRNLPRADLLGNDSNLLIVFYVQIMPDDFVMQLHRF